MHHDYSQVVLDAYDQYESGQDSTPAPAAAQAPDTLGASSAGPSSSGPGHAEHLALAEQHHESQFPADVQSSYPEPEHQDHWAPASGNEHHAQSHHPDSALVSTVLPPRPPPETLYSPRSTRSHSLAASLASLGSQSPIKRKPLSPTASPLAVRFSSHTRALHDHDLDVPDSGYYSLNSPDLYELPPTKVQGPVVGATVQAPREDDRSDDESEYNWPSPPRGPVAATRPETRNSVSDANPADAQTDDLGLPGLLTAAHVTGQATPDTDRIDFDDSVSGSSPNTIHSGMSIAVRKIVPQQLDLDHPNPVIQQAASSLAQPPDTASSLNKPLPRSPPVSPPARSPAGSSKFSNFFGWGSPSLRTAAEPQTKETYSPIPSPTSAKSDPLSDVSPETEVLPIPVQSPPPRGSALGYVETYFPTPPSSYSEAAILEIEEMEDELKAISAELASSIRREMDLEDLVERLQAEVADPEARGKRSSDYFSDSGYSTAKYSESDQTKDEISLVQRRADQEKAQLRLELTSKLQEERSRRNVLDQQIKELGEKAAQVDTAQMTSKDADARVKELEKTCEDLRRRLSEEKQIKDNFEDLLSALKGELQTASMERDNLRDEVVPQLRARVEGLESQQADSEKLAYETTKMQQELQALRDSKTKNDSLARLRSSSITGQSFKLGRPPSGMHSVGLSRSNTVKTGHVETREALSERLKDVEAQRDALHTALKNLLDRQEFQNRENEKKIKNLEVERDRLLSASPRKAGFEREVSTLREEVNVLRRRAEEAIEQKWQVEKGLIGLKSDLDRAEEEITSLRALLNEKDILIPDQFNRYSSSSTTDPTGVAATSSSLEKAYKELQKSYMTALEGIKDLDVGGTSAAEDERTRMAMKKLEQSLSAALLERDDARLEAAAMQDEVASMQEAEKAHLESEGDLADQLRDSANRVDELTKQVRAQLDINSSLRTRLTDALTRGESTQRANKDRLASMQNRMRVLEEQVISAQTAAEERVNRHEEELASLRDANNGNLHRRTDTSGSGMRSPRLFPPKSPMLPLLSPNSDGRFPRMLSSHSRKSSRVRSSTAEQQEEDDRQVESLKERIAELEKALVTADFEMQEVVSRMNTAQIDVMTLQEEREAAARETKKLQKQLEAERVRAFQERFNTISG
ncbi:hypothetical protein BD289DRAFT_361177 [Coniella lustricola]|uniref:DUF7603 domain-containing protein n=1 Tax=Coniella lustricola TaxID=2025994 RepID=A0A2T3AIR0_9PEZI|nr:hypothetical protein BD289DRAFT_361177 [Coniella lustricola]